MRVFVDECVNKRLLRHLVGHDVVHATNTPLRGMKNGVLLSAVAPDYEISLTLDKNIRFQQNLKNFPLTFVIMHSAYNALKDLLPLLPDVLSVLNIFEAGDLAPGALHEIKPR